MNLMALLFVQMLATQIVHVYCYEYNAWLET